MKILSLYSSLIIWVSLVCGVGAVESLNEVDISVIANWNETPLKLNILESAAFIDENLYQPLVLKLLGLEYDADADEIIQSNEVMEEPSEISDSEYFEFASSLLKDETEKSLLALYTANKLKSPRIQAHYNYYNSTIKSTHDCGKDTVLFEAVGSEYYCESDAAFALKDVQYSMIFEKFKLPFDRWLGKALAPKHYIIYGDYSDTYFREMFFNMYQFAHTGKLNLIWRYTPNPNNTRPEYLSGYGVSMNLKQTDYVTIDDRDLTGSQQENLIMENEEGIDNNSTNEDILAMNHADIEGVAAGQIKSLGLKTTKFLIDSMDQIQSLVQTISEFPKYASAISKLEYNETELEEIHRAAEKSYRSYIPTGILINDALVPSEKTTLFEILKTIKREASFINFFESISIDYDSAKEIMTGFANSMLNIFHKPTNRYDLSSFHKYIVYLNDIEIDKRYKHFVPSKQAYSVKPAPGHLPHARENIHELIFAVDLTDNQQLPFLLQFYQQVVQQLLPVRIGIVPFIESNNSKWAGNAVNQLYGAYRESGPNGAVGYLSDLNRFVASKEPLSLFSFRAFDQPFLEDIVKTEYFNKLAELYATFSLNQGQPLIFSNGIIYYFEDLEAAINQLYEDMMYLTGSLINGRISENIKLSTYLKKGSVKLRNKALIPDTIAQYKEVYLDFPSNIHSLKHWHNVDNIKVVKMDNEKASVLTINLVGTFLDIKYIEQVKQMLEYSLTAKNVKIVISDVDATSPFKKMKYLSTEEQITFLNSIGMPSIADDREAKANHDIVRELYGLEFDSDEIYMIIGGRLIEITSVISSYAIASVVQFERYSRINTLKALYDEFKPTINIKDIFDQFEYFAWFVSYTYFFPIDEIPLANTLPRISTESLPHSNRISKISDNERLSIKIIVDPVTEEAQELISYVEMFASMPSVSLHVHLRPNPMMEELPIKRFYKGLMKHDPYDSKSNIVFESVPAKTLFEVELHEPQKWLSVLHSASTDMANLKLELTKTSSASATFLLKNILVEGYSKYFDGKSYHSPAGLAVELVGSRHSDTNVMANYGYFQLKANPGIWKFQIKPFTKGSDIYYLEKSMEVLVDDLDGNVLKPLFLKRYGMESLNLVKPINPIDRKHASVIASYYLEIKSKINSLIKRFIYKEDQADVNIFTVVSGHLYERFLGIMMTSVMKNTNSSVKFWLIENYMSPSFRDNISILAKEYGFQYELVSYKWPIWLREQSERQRTIWGYKILFLDVLFPQDLKKVIFVDADQVVRADLKDLMDIDLKDNPYGFPPMCDSRKEMEGFRFWKTGYWSELLGDDLKYHISALYVVDLLRFRSIAAGDILRHHYQILSADESSLSNLDQDLPNNLQRVLKIHSLPQDWLWCETWCSDESLVNAKTIDLCNNPLTKESKLDRAKRQISEWSLLDEEVTELISKKQTKHNPPQYVHDEL